MTGGEVLVKMLTLHGLRYAFGMGGYQLLPYYDALARQNYITHVLIHDERDGAFSADGYARVAHRPALVDGTLGPGATNLVTGCAEALLAGIPLIAITGEVNTSIAMRGATQESDQVSALRAVSKIVITVPEITRIPELVRRAYATAVSGRPGPAVLNLSETIMHGVADFEESQLYADPANCLLGYRRAVPSAPDVARAIDLLRSAKRPVILAGGGIHLSGAYEELDALARTLGAPIAYTMSGKGCVADSHPLSIGLAGRYSRLGNQYIARSDLLVVLGSKLGEISTNRWTTVPEALPLLHIDVDATELGKVYRTEVGLAADLRDTLRIITGGLLAADGRLETWQGTIGEEIRADQQQWQESIAAKARASDTPVHMARLLAELREAMPDDARLVADGGFAAHWSALLFDTRVAGRTFIANRGHASIGYGLPGAIGAKLADPSRMVVALCGDNGFAMAASELETARRTGANIVCVVVDNAGVGYVKALQHALYSDRFQSVDFMPVDYAAVAEAHGAVGLRVETSRGLGPALEQALSASALGPVVVDVQTTREPAEMLPGVDSRVARPRQPTSPIGVGIAE